ncbi:MAG TPA: hypothetical protein VNN62_01425 [Methylomirabilota bacterium]|jgi:flagellar basal body L-ring protein FlgH|nr:hypothetical protein [Methylomirabilota bacterium]
MQRKLFVLSLIAAAFCWITSASAADTHQGKVVEAGAGKLTMTDTAGKNQHTHTIPSEATISRDGKTAALTDLKPGDTVTVTMDKKGDKSEVTKVEAKSTSS